jgi:CRP/FNR family cyclic AMP-dependent transcriptional regulator
MAYDMKNFPAEPCCRCRHMGGYAMTNDGTAGFQKSLAALPVTIYQAGETVLAQNSRTDRLLILRKGNIAVVKDGIEIARVTEPGAVFGEISALLNCPHTADVRALATSEFHVAHPTAIQDPAVLLYVAKILARRLDDGNQGLVEALVELKRQTRSAIDKTIRNIERLGADSYLKEAEQLRRSEDDAAVLATVLEDIKAAGLIDSKPDKEIKR